MFELTAVTATIYSVLFACFYYTLVCIFKKQILSLQPRKLLYYISIFCLFGVAGEIFVNTLYTYIFHTPLWEYRLFPAHNGDVSYFFIFVWGELGFYKYINDTAFHRFTPDQHIVPGLIMGSEAILLEILYNGLFLLLFGSYIFYYLPGNVSIFSHLSCLQVIPFYFLVGFCINELINQQNKIGYGRCLYIILPFYWMIIASLIF